MTSPLLPEAVAQMVAVYRSKDDGTVHGAFCRDTAEMLTTLAAENATLRDERDEARTWLGAANNEFGSAAWDWPDLWRRISQLKELSNSRWQSLNAAQDELATLRASEAAAMERVKVLEEALMIYADSCDKTETKSCGYDGNMCCRSARAALTPTADKE